MKIQSTRPITAEQAIKVAPLFTYDDYASGNMSVYVNNEPDMRLEVYTTELDEFLSMVDLPVYAAPTYTQLQQRMIERNIWLCGIISNEDRTEHRIGFENFVMPTVFKHIRDITPSHWIEANVELLHLANRVTALASLPF